MDRLATFLLAFFALWLGVSSIGRGAVKSLDDLSARQISALQESDQRLDIFDRQLQVLDQERASGMINQKVYDLQSKKQIALIRDEAEFQNALLVKQSTFQEHSLAVLRTVGKLSVEIPFLILTGNKEPRRKQRGITDSE